MERHRKFILEHEHQFVRRKLMDGVVYIYCRVCDYDNMHERDSDVEA